MFSLPAGARLQTQGSCCEQGVLEMNAVERIPVSVAGNRQLREELERLERVTVQLKDWYGIAAEKTFLKRQNHA